MALQPARITLAYAIEQRDQWYQALEHAQSGKSYSIGGRTLTRQDIGDINETLARWIDTVKTLDARVRGKVRKMHARSSFDTPGSGSGNLYPQELWEDGRT